VGGLGDVDRDAQAARERGQAGDVVLMFVGDEDGVERGGVLVGQGHALQQFAAGEAGIDQDAGLCGGDDRGVALGAGGENGHAHSLKIRRMAVECGDLLGLVGWECRKRFWAGRHGTVWECGGVQETNPTITASR
jgi:hypothetical protein